MKFSTRLVLSAVVPALMFFIALGAALFGQFRTEQDFGVLMAREQKLASGFENLYGHGLQAGQALRNILLDPANQKAFENFKAAREAYDKAYGELGAVAVGTDFEASTRALASLRATQSTAQDTVLAMARQDQPGAIAALNAKETPAWRALRAELLKLGAQARKTAAAAQEQTHQAASQARTLAAVLAALAAVVAGALLLLSQRAISRELGGEPKEAGAAMRRIASGDLSVELPLGTHERSLMAELSRMQLSLRKVVGTVRNSSDSIATGSAQIAGGNADLSQRTEEQASALQQTAASMEELGSTVKANADNARHANQLALSASTVAVQGGEVVSRVVETMKGINDSSKKIADIIGVIDGIAFQTNILALNAAVEAARAGEQGRGFAVVASEVRSLAQRSAEAAKEIKGLIAASVERVEEGTALVDHAGSTMTEVVSSIKRVADIVGEISSASSEQSLGVNQVGEAVSQMDHVTQQNAALVEESAAAAESLKQQAQQLVSAVAVFKLAG